MTQQKQIVFILSLAISLGLLRSFFLDDPEFTLIKQERVIEQVHSFKVPDDMTGPMMVNLEFSKYHFDAGSAIFIAFNKENEAKEKLKYLNKGCLFKSIDHSPLKLLIE